jgi:hypothetical protein
MGDGRADAPEPDSGPEPGSAPEPERGPEALSHDPRPSQDPRVGNEALGALGSGLEVPPACDIAHLPGLAP